MLHRHKPPKQVVFLCLEITLACKALLCIKYALLTKTISYTPMEKKNNRMQRYREKLKETGGRVVRTTLTGNQAKALDYLIEKYNFRHEDLFSQIVCEFIDRLLSIQTAQVELYEKHSEELALAYFENELNRNMPLTAQEFLNQQGNKQNEI